VKEGQALGARFGCSSSRLVFRRLLALKKFGPKSPFAEDTWTALWRMQLFGIVYARSPKQLLVMFRMIFSGLCLRLVSANSSTAIGQWALEVK
jgi:hypothetical protein